jgi:hypothetical protein
MGVFTGTPPKYDVKFGPTQKSPGFDFAKFLSGYLKTLVGKPMPSYQGPIDPGMSPTMANVGMMMQQRSQMPMPWQLNAAASTLGRFSNPSFTNPVARMQMGAPSYFGFNPNQQTYGGKPMGDFAQLGMSGPMGQGMPGMPPPSQLPAPPPAFGG